jgi:hypothetical protein
MTRPRFIPDIIRDIVFKVDAEMSAKTNGTRVFFDYGHYREIVKNLEIKDGSITMKDEKYPLVWLVMDFVEEIYPESHIYARVNLQLFIIDFTTVNRSMDQRRDEVYLRTLYPIYEELIRQFSECDEVVDAPLSYLPHTKIDRPFWGKPDQEGNNLSDFLNDYVDAIQIKDMVLNIRPVACVNLDI